MKICDLSLHRLCEKTVNYIKINKNNSLHLFNPFFIIYYSFSLITKRKEL